MKSGVADATKLKSLIKRVGSHDPVPSAGEGETGYDDPIAVLVFSFLLWESTTQQAQDAMRKIIDATVDFNELRVSLPNEILAVIGSRYPRGVERAQRLKSALHSIYLDQHAVSLDHLQSVGKREVRQFLEGLTGIPAYVSARVLQRCYDVHAIPVDERLVELLVDKGVLKEVVEPEELSKWLSRQVTSANGRSVEATLRVFVDTEPKPARKPAAKSPAEGTKKKAAKKSTSKTTKNDAKSDAKSDAKKTTKKAPKKTTKKAPAKKTAKKASDKKTTKKTAKKPAKKPAKKSAKKTSKTTRRS